MISILIYIVTLILINITDFPLKKYWPLLQDLVTFTRTLTADKIPISCALVGVTCDVISWCSTTEESTTTKGGNGMWPQSQSLHHPKDLPQGSPRVRDYKPQCKRHAPSSGGSLATQDAEFYTVGGNTRVVGVTHLFEGGWATLPPPPWRRVARRKCLTECVNSSVIMFCQKLMWKLMYNVVWEFHRLLGCSAVSMLP